MARPEFGIWGVRNNPAELLPTNSFLVNKEWRNKNELCAITQLYFIFLSILF
jgi:hypothetical protein